MFGLSPNVAFLSTLAVCSLLLVVALLWHMLGSDKPTHRRK